VGTEGAWCYGRPGGRARAAAAAPRWWGYLGGRRTERRRQFGKSSAPGRTAVELPLAPSVSLSICRLPSTIYHLPPATCHLPPDTYRLPNCLSRPGPLTHHHPHTHTQHLRPPLWTPSTATPVHVERSPTHSDEKRERERERVRVRLTQRGLPADALVYSQFPLNVCRPRKRGRAAA
jgi:hypothetical protein